MLMSQIKIFGVSIEVMRAQKNVHPRLHSCASGLEKTFTSALQALSSADALAKVDNLALIQPRVDTADAAALGTTEMGADVVPVPLRQIGELQIRVMMAALAIRGLADAPERHPREATWRM
jgi:hypothetical protein